MPQDEQNTTKPATNPITSTVMQRPEGFFDPEELELLALEMFGKGLEELVPEQSELVLQAVKDRYTVAQRILDMNKRAWDGEAGPSRDEQEKAMLEALYNITGPYMLWNKEGNYIIAPSTEEEYLSVKKQLEELFSSATQSGNKDADYISYDLQALRMPGSPTEGYEKYNQAPSPSQSNPKDFGNELPPAGQPSSDQNPAIIASQIQKKAAFYGGFAKDKPAIVDLFGTKFKVKADYGMPPPDYYAEGEVPDEWFNLSLEELGELFSTNTPEGRHGISWWESLWEHQIGEMLPKAEYTIDDSMVVTHNASGKTLDLSSATPNDMGGKIDAFKAEAYVGPGSSGPSHPSNDTEPDLTDRF